jgi:alpha-1,3-glucosyltransferase
VTKFRLFKGIKLLSVALGVSFISLGPFIKDGGWHHLLTRLFPFKRGLLHFYWAANFWAPYIFIDLFSGLLKFPSIDFIKSQLSTTNSLIDNYTTFVLPNITPIHTFVITLTFLIVSRNSN